MMNNWLAGLAHTVDYLSRAALDAEVNVKMGSDESEPAVLVGNYKRAGVGHSDVSDRMRISYL